MEFKSGILTVRRSTDRATNSMHAAGNVYCMIRGLHRFCRSVYLVLITSVSYKSEDMLQFFLFQIISIVKQFLLTLDRFLKFTHNVSTSHLEAWSCDVLASGNCPGRSSCWQTKGSLYPCSIYHQLMGNFRKLKHYVTELLAEKSKRGD